MEYRYSTHLPHITFELWVVKLAALLHDVPWKPWIVAFYPRDRVIGSKKGWRHVCNCCSVWKEVLGEDGRECPDAVRAARLVLELGEIKVKDYCWEERANGVEACNLLEAILQAVEQAGFPSAAEKARNTLSRMKSGVKKADEFSSGVDRYIATALAQRMNVPSPKKVVYVNVFNPSIKYEYDSRRCMSNMNEYKDKVARYVCALTCLTYWVLRSAALRRNRLEDEDVIRLVYNLLYALLEPLWYSVAGLGCVPPAETRFPTHTVFDHLYSAAFAVNMLQETWCGVSVEVQSIQGFVGRGRKTRDFWAGSWLVSLLVWKAVEPLVDAYGPDIILAPYTPINPFYLAYLAQLAERLAGIGEELAKVLRNLVVTYKDGWPSQPLQPASITLVIPVACRTLKHNVEKVISECFKNAWTSIASRLLGESLRGVIETLRSIERDVKLKVELDEDSINDYLSDARPPLHLNIVQVDSGEVKKRSKSLAAKAVGEEEKPEEGKGEEDIVGGARRKLEDIYEITSLLELLREKRRNTCNVRASSAALTATWAEKYTTNAYSSARRYRMCSVCGKLPAVVYVSRATRKVNMPLLIDEGEALCPVCLVKRLAGRNPQHVLEALGYSVAARAAPSGGSILSTMDLARYWYGVRRGKNRHKYAEVLENILKGRAEHVCGKDKELCEVLDRLIGVAEHIYAYTPVPGAGRPEHTVYASVIGDGDRIGSGYWSGILGLTPEEYVERVYESTFGAEMLKKHDDLRRAVEEHKKIMRRVVNALPGSQKTGKQTKKPGSSVTVPLSPVYIFTLSKALALTSIIDAIVVDALGGVLVYAGGDDVYALVPNTSPPIRLDSGVFANPLYAALLGAYATLYRGRLDDASVAKYVRLLVEKLRLRSERSLEEWSLYIGGEADATLVTVLVTRLNYWGVLDSYAYGELHPGFHILPAAAVAATVAYGRSYGVRYAHYREPLWLVYDSSRAAEEEKDEAKIWCSERRHEKDVSIVTRGEDLHVLSNIACNGSPTEIDKLVLDSPLYHAIALHTRIPALISRGAPHRVIDASNVIAFVKHAEPYAVALQYAEILSRACRRCNKRRLATLFELDAGIRVGFGEDPDKSRTQLHEIFQALALKV